jgi:DNA-directed RNA polymerase specialized sigma subunit
MRDRMPKVAAFVDDLREAFGTEYINGAIREGLRGRPVFWASENGHELGTRPPSVVDRIEEQSK